MAFFCTKTGERIVAPGVHASVQPGGMPSFDDSPASRSAESAAVESLAVSRRSAAEIEPSPDAQARARDAATKALGAQTKNEPPKGGRSPRPKDDKHSEN